MTRLRVVRVALPALGLIVALTGLRAGAQQSITKPAGQPELPRPTFDTKTELVLVDVTVVDRESNQVPDLTTADVDLQVNGQPRSIASLQFVSTIATETTPATPREAQYTSNASVTTGRLLLFVVDESHLRMGSSRAVLRTAEILMDRLAPGDLIGLARLPGGAGGVEFTADRARVRAALANVTGSAGGRLGMTKLRISEAWALESNDAIAWEQAIDRECAGEVGVGRQICADAVEADARNLLLESSSRTQATLRNLEALLGRLAALRTPVNIVMISEGLFIARDRTSMSDIARRAAEARATLHIVRPGQTLFDVEDTQAPGMSRLYDDGLMREGLEQLAGQTRGTMTQVVASADIIFDRLGRELSGYYLIGFEPTDADRTGKERRIRVQVKRRDLVVRARPTFVLRNAASGAAEPAFEALPPVEQVRQLISAPLPTRGLPIRVASYTVTTTGKSEVRVVISAEIGEPASESAQWTVAVVLIDKNDKVIVNNAGASRLAPASEREESPRLFLTSVLVEPGEYTLRLAAIDSDGNAGSVHHSINARFKSAGGGLNVSDLMVLPQPPRPEATPRLRPSGVVDSETLTAMLEMTSTDTALLGRAKVAVQIADSESGSTLVNAEARQASRAQGQRSFAATLRLGVLPPGEYFARAIVTVPGRPETRLVRPFLLSPAAAASTTAPPDLSAPLDPDAPAAPPPPIKILAPVPAFVPSTVLEVSVLGPFLDGLTYLHPPSAAVEAVIEEARNGRFAVPEGPGATPDDEIALTFVRGLSAFQQGNIAQASSWFQQTMKGASDFLGAAFYMGACHAASGRDRDAIGAWQIALLSENPGAVYPALVDALLRVGEGRQAVDFLQEAPQAWTDDRERIKREATAEAMLGDYDSALPKLTELVNAQRVDQNLLFVAIQVLYRMHLDNKGMNAKHKVLFTDLVKRHQEMGGPNRALVETYRRYVLR
ncbi:MAG: VWA domain-containing protein [Vicinamibacterales bacterium]